MTSIPTSLRRAGTGLALVGLATLGFVAVAPAASADPPSATITYQCSNNGTAVAIFSVGVPDLQEHHVTVRRQHGGPFDDDDFVLNAATTNISGAYGAADGEYLNVMVLEAGNVLAGDQEIRQADTSEPDCWKPWSPSQTASDPDLGIEIVCAGETAKVTLTATATDDSMHPLYAVKSVQGLDDGSDQLTVGPGQPTNSVMYTNAVGSTVRFRVFDGSVDGGEPLLDSGWLLVTSANPGCLLPEGVDEPPVDDPTGEPPMIDWGADCVDDPYGFWVSAEPNDDGPHTVEITIDFANPGTDPFVQDIVLADGVTGDFDLDLEPGSVLRITAREGGDVIYQSDWITPTGPGFADTTCLPESDTPGTPGPLAETPSSDPEATPPAAAAEDTTVEAVTATAAAPELPRTGAGTARAAVAGVALLGLGAALRRTARHLTAARIR